MTEKRFEKIEVDNNYHCVNMIVGKKFGSYSEQALEDLLNELHEENMMLKGEVAHYKLILMSLEEEAKRLSQIKRS